MKTTKEKTKHITYNCNQYPIRISFYAFKCYVDETKKMEITDYADVEVLLWYALISGHKIENKQMTLKREEMYLILDESMDEFMEIVKYFFPTNNNLIGPFEMFQN